MGIHRPELTVDGLCDPVALLDREGRILSCNQAWKERLPQRNLLRVLSSRPERLELRERVRDVLAGLTDTSTVELAWEENIWMRAKLKRLPPSMKAGQAVISMEDISERIALQQKEALFKSQIDGAADPLFILDTQTLRTIYGNAALLRHLELDSQNDLHLSCYGPLFDRQHLPKLIERLGRANSLTLEVLHRTARGRAVPVEFSLTLLYQSTNRTLIVGSIRDVTQRKQNLSALRSASSRLAVILDSAPVSIITLTLEGYIASWNRAAQRMYGWSSDEVMLQNLPFDPDPCVIALTLEVIKLGRSRSLLVERCDKDGTKLRLSLSISPLFDDSGNISGLLEVAEDITDRSHAELVEINRRLLEAAESERLHLARELHDGVLQDLVAVGFALSEIGYQQEKRQAPVGERELLREQQNQVLSLARLLRGVVTELRPAGLGDLGLASSLKELVDKLIPLSSGIEVSADLETIDELSPPQRLCLYRCTQEALHNCRKHAHPQKIALSLKRSGTNAELVVRDDGEGFVVTENFQGLTLASHYGLAGMAERAELTRSYLQVHSSPGRGTEIRLTMPLTAIARGVDELS